MFDHVGIAVSDLAASQRFYRTVLSVLGAEPSHADAELVEWEDWDIGPPDADHPRNHVDRDVRGELRNQIGLSCIGELIDQVHADLPDLRLSGTHVPRGERLLRELPEPGVSGRVKRVERM